MARRAKRNYINNSDFTEAIIDYKKTCEEAEEAGDDLPRVPNYIGECLMKISKGVGARPNFSGYSYRDEMVSDGIENGLRALRNFDPEKTRNPFGYFTQIIWYAFLRRISSEHKQTYVKHKVAENHIVQGTAVAGGEEQSSHIIDFLGIDRESTTSFVENYEDKLNKNKEKKEPPTDEK